MRQNAVRWTDVSLTDGQSAVWAGAMTTAMAASVAGQLAAARPDVLEVISPSTMRQCVARGEDPWQRIDIVRERCPALALRAQVHALTEHGQRGADTISLSVGVQWLRALAQHGVDEVLFVDPLQDMPRAAPWIAECSALGMTPIGALVFHEDEDLPDHALCEQAAAWAAAGAARVMLRDEAGVLSPDRLATLLPALRQALGTTPLDLHLRCQTALAPMVALQALQGGIDGLDTACAALANGASVPSFGTLVTSSRALQMQTCADGVRLEAVAEANRRLVALADCHGFPAAQPWAFQLAPYLHQLPGEVAAHAMECLADLQLLPRLKEFADECARIRMEMGKPPMLAPFARAMAEQALMHLRGLPRYAEMRPGIRRLIQQAWGPTPGAVDAPLQRRVGRIKPHARSLEELQAACPAASDAQQVLAQVCGVAPAALPAPAPHDALVYVAATPQDALVAGLSARAAHFAQIEVSGPDFEICVRREEEPSSC